MVRGVILAAGASSRMGRSKAALPLTDPADTFVRRLVTTFLVGGIPDVLVVTGADPEAVRDALRPSDPRVRLVHNPDWMQGQLSSLNAALRAPSRGGAPDVVEAVVMTLVDIPLVSAQTVASVLGRWRATRAPIVRPSRGDEHGHPVLFDRALFSELLRANPATGAKSIVRAHGSAIENVPTTDEGAFVDVDTEADYAALRRGSPSAERLRE
jgi:molybdenum cofactor cytidylyltransferase